MLENIIGNELAMQNNINSSYVILAGDHGHESFLFHTDMYSKIIRKFITS